MTKANCEIYEHIFSVTNNVLMCEKCNKTYADYLVDVEIHKNAYRNEYWPKQ